MASSVVGDEITDSVGSMVAVYSGIFGMLAILKDPKMQAALSFFVEFMKRYGEKMK